MFIDPVCQHDRRKDLPGPLYSVISSRQTGPFKNMAPSNLTMIGFICLISVIRRSLLRP